MKKFFKRYWVYIIFMFICVVVITLSSIPCVVGAGISLPAIASSVASIVALFMSMITLETSRRNFEVSEIEQKRREERDLLIKTFSLPNVSNVSFDFSPGLVIYKPAVANVFAFHGDVAQLRNQNVFSPAIALSVDFSSDTSNFLSSFLVQNIQIEICNNQGTIIGSLSFDKISNQSLVSRSLCRNGPSFYLNLYLVFFSSLSLPSKQYSALSTLPLAPGNFVVLSLNFSSQNLVGVKSEGMIRFSALVLAGPNKLGILPCTIKDQSVSIAKISVGDQSFPS